MSNIEDVFGFKIKFQLSEFLIPFCTFQTLYLCTVIPDPECVSIFGYIYWAEIGIPFFDTIIKVRTKMHASRSPSGSLRIPWSPAPPESMARERAGKRASAARMSTLQPRACATGERGGERAQRASAAAASVHTITVGEKSRHRD